MAEGKDGGLSAVRFLTVAEVAAQLRVSRMTVYRLCADGELPSWRVRRAVREPAIGLHRYMQARLAETP
jgi:excisionase family DNA binding protein